MVKVIVLYPALKSRVAILRANDIYTELRGRRKKNSPEQRPKRIIENIVGINIPLKAYHYQIRVCDELYDQINYPKYGKILDTSSGKTPK